MNDTVLGFHFDPALCIGCHACEVACKSWRGLENGIHWRRVQSRFAGSFPSPRLISISVSCLHCTDAPCLSVCPAGAISRSPDGAVLADPALCIGCRQCASVCPTAAPRFGADGTMQKCDLCHGLDQTPCVLACPSGALRLCAMTAGEKDAENRRLTELLHG